VCVCVCAASAGNTCEPGCVEPEELHNYNGADVSSMIDVVLPAGGSRV